MMLLSLFRTKKFGEVVVLLSCFQILLDDVVVMLLSLFRTKKFAEVVVLLSCFQILANYGCIAPSVKALWFCPRN